MAALAPAIAVLADLDLAVRGLHLLTLMARAGYPGLRGTAERWERRQLPGQLGEVVAQLAALSREAREEAERRKPPPPPPTTLERQSPHLRKIYADTWIEPEPLRYPLTG